MKHYTGPLSALIVLVKSELYFVLFITYNNDGENLLSYESKAPCFLYENTKTVIYCLF